MAKKKKFNSDKLLGISAMSISFITLLIFIYQTNLMNRQNYLSILPYLSLSTSNSSINNHFSLSLDNHGVGPAIIESVMIKDNGKTYDLADFDNSVFAFLESKSPAIDSIKVVSYSSLDKGMAIPVNTSYTIFEVEGSKEDYLSIRNNLNSLLEAGLRLEIIYTSIQNERWLISNDTKGPQKLD